MDIISEITKTHLGYSMACLTKKFSSLSPYVALLLVAFISCKPFGSKATFTGSASVVSFAPASAAGSVWEYCGPYTSLGTADESQRTFVIYTAVTWTWTSVTDKSATMKVQGVAVSADSHCKTRTINGDEIKIPSWVNPDQSHFWYKSLNEYLNQTTIISYKVVSRSPDNKKMSVLDEKSQQRGDFTLLENSTKMKLDQTGPNGTATLEFTLVPPVTGFGG